MKVVINVETSDGSVRAVRVSPLAIIGWERQTGRKLSDLGQGIGMVEIATLAYEQDRLAGNTDATDLEGYLENVVDLDPVVGNPNPSGEEASDDSSSS